jgi:hypothetical protein
MNKNSLFTKAIAGFLAVLMVLGTLVSLRGFSVKAETVNEDSAVRSEQPTEGSKGSGVDFRVVSNDLTAIYEIPHSVHKSVYYNTQNPYDYRQYEAYTVGWYDSGKVAVHGHTTRYTYGYDMNGGSPIRLYLAQDQYWEPGAKNEVGGKPVPYTAPTSGNFPDWKADENRDWIREIGNQYPDYNLFVNKSTKNKNYWLGGTSDQNAQLIWDKARMFVYMSNPEHGAGAQQLYDELYNYINGTIFPKMKNEVYKDKSVTQWFQSHNGSSTGTGALIRLGNDRYLGADVTVSEQTVYPGDYHKEQVLSVSWHNSIDKNSAVYKEFVELMIQHAILALTSGNPFNNQWSWNMGMGPKVNDKDTLRVERARMTNVGDPVNQTTGENSGYVRMIVNKLLEMADNKANRDKANSKGFEFGYVWNTTQLNESVNPQDKYHYHGCFYGVNPSEAYTSVEVNAVFEYANNTTTASNTFKRPSSVKAVLFKIVDGKKTQVSTVDLSGDSWKHTFSNLPKAENGKTITYTVELAEVGGISLSNNNYPWSDKPVRKNSDTSFTIPLYPFTNVLLFKQWYKADGTTRVYPQPGNGDGLKTEAIPFTVKNSENTALDPVATLYGSSNVSGATWKYKWSRIPVVGADASGKPVFTIDFPARSTNTWKNPWIAFTKDNNTDNRGVKTFFDEANNVFNFEVYSKLNTSTTVKVNAVFEYYDNTNTASEVFVKPSTVKATLYKTVDGEDPIAIGTVDLTSANGWTYEWTDLPEYENGKQITYTVQLAKNGIVEGNPNYPWKDKTIRVNGNEYTIPLYPFTNVFLFKQWYNEDCTARVYPQPDNPDGLATEYVQFTVTGKNGAPSSLEPITLYGDANQFNPDGSKRTWQYKWTGVRVTGVGADGNPEYELNFTGRSGAWSSYRFPGNNDFPAANNDRGIASAFDATKNEYYFYVYSKLDSKIEVIVNAVFEYADTENAAATLFTRPSTVKATLYKSVNGEQPEAIGTKELNAANGWGDSWQGLDANDENGNKITYTVKLADENGIVLADDNYKWSDKDVRESGTDGAPVFTIPLYPKTNVHIFKRWYSADGSTQVYPQPASLNGTNGLDNEHVTFTIHPTEANLQVVTLYDQANVPGRTWQYLWADIDVIEPMMNQYGELDLSVTHTGRSDKWINFPYKLESDENGHRYFYNATTNTYHFEVNSKLDPKVDVKVEAKFEYKDTTTTANDMFKRPASVNAALYRTVDGNKVFVGNAELNVGGNWINVFENQPKYDPQGRLYTYSVELAAENGIVLANFDFPWSTKVETVDDQSVVVIRYNNDPDAPEFEIPLFPKTNVQVFKLWYDYAKQRVYPQPGNSSGLDNEHIEFTITTTGNIQIGNKANLYDDANIVNATWKYKWTEVDVTQDMLDGDTPIFNMAHEGRSPIWEDYAFHEGFDIDGTTDENGTLSSFNGDNNTFYFEVHSKLKAPGGVQLDKDAYLTEDGTYTMELYVWAKDNKVTLKDGNMTQDMNDEAIIKDQLSDLFEYGPDKKVEIVLRKFQGYDSNGNAKFVVEEGMDDLKNEVKETAKFDGDTLSIYGFDFNNYVCKTEKGESSGYQLVVVISGILAKDNEQGFANELISSKAGVYMNEYSNQYARVISLNQQSLVADQQLIFPEKKVSIRYRYIVYDFGLTMKDNDSFTEFFNDAEMHAGHAAETEVKNVLSVDYMFPKQTEYHTKYPYNGARVRVDNPITGTSAMMVYGGRGHHFEFGFENVTGENGEKGTRGYFTPNEIAYRDWEASALLELQMNNSSAWEPYSCNKNENPKYEWCSVEFIPATTVLYEADQEHVAGSYIDQETQQEVTIKRPSFAEYFDTNANADDTNADDQKGTWNRAGSFNTAAHQQHYNNLYGYDPAYVGAAALDTDSNGSAMKVTVTKDMYEKIRDDESGESKWPYMKFTFTGTGFSFTTRCALDTGVFLIDVVPAGQDQYYQGGPSTIIDENGEEVEVDYNSENFGKTYIHTIINTRYYGGSGFNPADTTPVNNQSVLHQVPVVRITDLAYNAADPYATGTYDVYVTPVYLPSFAELPDAPTADSVNVKGGAIVGIPGAKGVAYTYSELFPKTEETKGIKLDEMNCYIDTIRVYHPRGSHYENATTLEMKAYYSAHELNCQFIEVRKLLISKISALLNGNPDFTIGGAMFIDYGPVDANGNHLNGEDFDPAHPDTFTVDHYKFYGPNNELYLPKGGSYAFSFADAQKVTNLHLSMKITGANVGGKLIVRLLSSDQAVASENPAQYQIYEPREIELKSTTEMYYDLLKGVRESCTVNGVLNETLFHEKVGAIKAVAVYNESDNDKVIVSIMNIKLVYDKGEHAKSGEKIFTSLETVEFANVLGFGIKGDANGDRSVDMSDALVIMRASLNSSAGLGISGTFCADYNDDGMIDMTDALSTMRKALN